MPDFPARGSELLKEIDTLAPSLPTTVIMSMRDLVSNYTPKRNACLEDLLRLLEDDSANAKNIDKWRDRCGSMRTTINAFFDKVPGGAPLNDEQKARVDRWQFSTISSEDRFFTGLSASNVTMPGARDFLVANRQGLSTYTADLETKWRALVDREKQIQSDEQRAYQEMLGNVREAIRSVAALERSPHEKAVQLAEQVRKLAADSSGAKVITSVPNLLMDFFLGKKMTMPPSDSVKQVATFYATKIDVWLATNKYILERMRRIESLVNAEKGGVLPLFRETRREVYGYWDRNNPDRARNIFDIGKQSLDAWASACPSDGQREDGRRFLNEASSRVENHLKAVQSIAKDFESRWEGVFKGPLATRTYDEFVDGAGWRTRASELASVQLGSVAQSMKSSLDGYYEQTLIQPLSQLRSAIESSNEPEKDAVVKAINDLMAQAQAEIASRILQMKQEIEKARDVLESGNLPKMLLHADMKGDIE